MKMVLALMSYVTPAQSGRFRIIGMGRADVGQVGGG